MSEIVAEGIIEAGRLADFAETFASKASGMKNPLVRECKMHFNGDGIHVAAVDAANVAMINPGNLSKRAFESYNAPGTVTTGINLERLIGMLGPAGADQLVEFAIDMETRSLTLAYGPADLSMTLIDPENIRKEPDNPDFDLPNTATITGEQFNHGLSVAELMSDHIRIVGDSYDDVLIFESRGDTDEGTVEYGSSGLIASGITEDAESLFSLTYLQAFAKPMPGDTEVTLMWGDQFPIRLSWEMFDGHFEVNQMLAPRIQSD